MARLGLQGLDKLGARAAFGGERSAVQAAPSLAVVLSSKATTESQAEAADANDSWYMFAQHWQANWLLLHRDCVYGKLCVSYLV